MIPCGSAMAILHDKEYKENDVDVEVQIEVKENSPILKMLNLNMNLNYVLQALHLRGLIVSSRTYMHRLQNGFLTMDIVFQEQ